MPGPIQQKMADYLASVNLSNAETMEFPLKPFARLTGRATHVIITEYDLPRKDAQPHDVVMDERRHGLVLGFQPSVRRRAGSGDRQGHRHRDPDDAAGPAERLARRSSSIPKATLWMSGMYQAGIYKIDPKTKQVTAYPLPKEWPIRPRRPRWCRRSMPTSTARCGPTTRTPTWCTGSISMTGKYEDLGQAIDKNGTPHQRLRHADR